MKTIAIVSQKGGSGKTTLATHLAAAATAAGYEACILDLDPQATAAAWGDWRDNQAPEVVTAPPARVDHALAEIAKAGAEFVIIDTPPHADAAAREAAKAADLVLVPCRPRAFDLHAIQTTAEMLTFGGKTGFVVFNAAPPRSPALVSEATTMVQKFGLQVVPVAISERAVYHHSTAAGKTALEDRGSKAAEEIARLWEWTCTHVHMPTRKQDENGAAA